MVDSSAGSVLPVFFWTIPLSIGANIVENAYFSKNLV
jgi:hypothetical protein